jgi:RNA polymerase sigma-70 factor (ECF subfamily)
VHERHKVTVTPAVEDKLDIERLRKQDSAEFTRFVRRHEKLVLGLAQSLGLSAADCEDAAAETFAVAYRALPSFRGESELSTWVYRIAYRTIVKVRHRYREMTAVPEQTAAAVAGPEQEAVQRESDAAVWNAVAKLDPDQAVAVELFYRRQMSVEEIAGVMEKPVGTVKTLLFRGRERLRVLLKPLEKLS